MGASAVCVSLFVTCLLFSSSYSASIARKFDRDLGKDIKRQVRPDSYSFYKDFGNTKVGGYYNKDQSGGFNASHNFDNGNLAGNLGWDNLGRLNGGFKGQYKDPNGGVNGKVDVDKDGNLSGGVSGDYTWNNGNTRFGGNLDFGAGGKPSGAFKFSHNF